MKKIQITKVGLPILVGLSSFSYAGENGTFSLDTRLRYETAEVTGLEDASNTSLRIRPGFLTPKYEGFQAMVEGEFTFPFDKDDYNAAGVHGNSEKAVIADPENAQLEQAWLSYGRDKYGLKVGRQVVALDGQRWIGHVGWRQNRQTYDAATFNYSPAEEVSLFYGYIDNVVRIFGEDAPSSGGNAAEFGSESHLVNISYNAEEYGKITAYGYFLDLEDSPGKIAGSDTIGVSYSGTYKGVENVPLSIYLEYASQSDAGDNVQDYTADYFHGALTANYSGFTLQAGYELLGSDEAGVDEEGNPAFASVKAPLATLHKFNGFADVFLVTPDKGLEDTYIMAGYKLDFGEVVGPVILKAWYHDFSTDEGGDDLGDEIDVVVAKPIKIEGLKGDTTLLAKFADYSAPEGGSDVTRFSIELGHSIKF